MAIPTFWDMDRGGESDPSQNLGHVGMPYPELSSIFPAFLGKNNWGEFRKVGINRGKSEKIEENWGQLGQSRLFPTYLEHFNRSGWPSRPIPTLREKLRWPSRPIQKCQDESGRLKNPDLNFGLRSRWPPWLISPILALNQRSLFGLNRLGLFVFCRLLPHFYQSLRFVAFEDRKYKALKKLGGLYI